MWPSSVGVFIPHLKDVLDIDKSFKPDSTNLTTSFFLDFGLGGSWGLKQGGEITRHAKVRSTSQETKTACFSVLSKTLIGKCPGNKDIQCCVGKVERKKVAKSSSRSR